MDTEKIVDLLKNRVIGSPKGICAVFVPISEKWAIKLFVNAYDRDNAHEIQSLYFKHGLAPEIGEKITFPDGITDGGEYSSVYKHGYFTEIITPVIPGIIKNMPRDLENERNELADKFIEEWGQEYDEEGKLWRKIQKWAEITGYEISDMHAGNLGWKDGELIPLDFGC